MDRQFLATRRADSDLLAVAAACRVHFHHAGVSSERGAWRTVSPDHADLRQRIVPGFCLAVYGRSEVPGFGGSLCEWLSLRATDVRAGGGNPCLGGGLFARRRLEGLRSHDWQNSGNGSSLRCGCEIARIGAAHRGLIHRHGGIEPRRGRMGQPVLISTFIKYKNDPSPPLSWMSA